jgi:hypothetical protein
MTQRPPSQTNVLVILTALFAWAFVVFAGLTVLGATVAASIALIDVTLPERDGNASLLALAASVVVISLLTLHLRPSEVRVGLEWDTCTLAAAAAIFCAPILFSDTLRLERMGMMFSETLISTVYNVMCCQDEHQPVDYATVCIDQLVFHVTDCIGCIDESYKHTDVNSK